MKGGMRGKVQNGRFRAECLNASWFHNLMDAKSKIRAWRDEYNGDSPRKPFEN